MDEVRLPKQIVPWSHARPKIVLGPQDRMRMRLAEIHDRPATYDMEAARPFGPDLRVDVCDLRRADFLTF